MTELLTKMLQGLAFVAAASLFLSNCSERPVPAERSPGETADSAVSFVNKVWRGSESSSVAPGSLYFFCQKAPSSSPHLIVSLCLGGGSMRAGH